MDYKAPTDLVFPTMKGKKDNRQNVRRRLFLPAIKRANERLTKLGIETIENVTPHGLRRRTYAALRAAVGDDPAYTAAQIGHEDAAFTLNVYTNAVKRRDRLAGTERAEFNRAIEWAQWAAFVPEMAEIAPNPTETEQTLDAPIESENGSTMRHLAA